jgi:hypothetical protein
LPERQPLLFGRGTRSGSISENTMLYGLYRLGYHKGVSPVGAATVTAEMRPLLPLAAGLMTPQTCPSFRFEANAGIAPISAVRTGRVG